MKQATIKTLGAFALGAAAVAAGGGVASADDTGLDSVPSSLTGALQGQQVADRAGGVGHDAKAKGHGGLLGGLPVSSLPASGVSAAGPGGLLG